MPKYVEPFKAPNRLRFWACGISANLPSDYAKSLDYASIYFRRKLKIKALTLLPELLFGDKKSVF